MTDFLELVTKGILRIKALERLKGHGSITRHDYNKCMDIFEEQPEEPEIEC